MKRKRMALILAVTVFITSINSISFINADDFSAEVFESGIEEQQVEEAYDEENLYIGDDGGEDSDYVEIEEDNDSEINQPANKKSRLN